MQDWWHSLFNAVISLYVISTIKGIVNTPRAYKEQKQTFRKSIALLSAISFTCTDGDTESYFSFVVPGPDFPQTIQVFIKDFCIYIVQCFISHI